MMLEGARYMRKLGKWMGHAAAGGVLAMMFAGCNTALKPTNENFVKALNVYYSGRNECLYTDSVHFPFEVSSTSKNDPDAQKMEALLHSQLLNREIDPELKAKRYTLTPMGERVGNRFCYGHRVITTVDSFTPPAPAHGFQETQVSYHFTMEDVPIWAKTDELRAAFPKMATNVAGQGEGKTTLALTGAGWQVSE
jgi:hypothetical protein